MACSLRLVMAGLHTVALRRRSDPEDGPIAATVATLAARIGVGRSVSVRISMMTDSPATLGFLRPVILLPPAVALGVTPQQLEALLAHELAHIRRHDYLVNVLQMLAETLFFYHPAVWWVSRRIRSRARALLRRHRGQRVRRCRWLRAGAHQGGAPAVRATGDDGWARPAVRFSRGSTGCSAWPQRPGPCPRCGSPPRRSF